VVLVTAKAISAASDCTRGWVGTVADVTVEAEAEVAMAAARDAALSANTMQQHFTAAASHELKTPTTSILGFLEEALESKTLSPRDRGFLAIAYRNAQRLARLIDDLLIVGRNDSGDLEMHPQPTPLVALAEPVVASFSAEAEHRKVDLVVVCEPGPLTALVDPLRLEQALVNLVSNALKFTPEGGKVTIHTRPAGDMVELIVADTGTGIDAHDLDNIFDRFYRTKTAADAGVKGSGLGLAIAKGMVESQGGTLSVASAPGRGSTFTMSLPMATEPETPGDG
jgi:signal transduction histidine kinase